MTGWCVSGFLVDEMYPATTATLLRDQHGRAAVHVADFSTERDVVLVFVLKRRLPAGGGQAVALATILDRWALANLDPYVGAHWPR